MRAIPWGFSWGQCRLLLPGWYGFGTAIARWLDAKAQRDEKRRHAAARCTQEWPFFATLLSNMDMVLAKTDLAIASRYAELVPDAELRERIFKRIAAEHGATLRCLELITGAHERLAGNPLLARSIQNRFAYLDPLNHLQVELIHRHRAVRRRPGARSTSGCTAASICRSTAWRPACAIPGDVPGGHDVPTCLINYCAKRFALADEGLDRTWRHTHGAILPFSLPGLWQTATLPSPQRASITCTVMLATAGQLFSLIACAVKV